MHLKDLTKFDAEYDTSHEDSALQTRGKFIRTFPLHSLDKLTLDEYVVGHHDPSFCNLVESGTKAWAPLFALPRYRICPICRKEACPFLLKSVVGIREHMNASAWK